MRAPCGNCTGRDAPPKAFRRPHARRPATPRGMSGTPASTPSMTPSWTLPLPAGGRRQFLHIDIEANIPADNGSHPRNGLAPGAEAHRPSPLPRIATTTSSFAPEAPQAPLRCNGATVAGEAWVALPYRRGPFGDADATPAPVAS